MFRALCEFWVMYPGLLEYAPMAGNPRGMGCIGMAAPCGGVDDVGIAAPCLIKEATAAWLKLPGLQGVNSPPLHGMGNVGSGAEFALESSSSSSRTRGLTRGGVFGTACPNICVLGGMLGAG